MHWSERTQSKDPPPNNYRPITCLPMMGKIFTEKIREEIYHSLSNCESFPDEQKGYDKGSRGTTELLYTDQHLQTEQSSYGLDWLQRGIWYGPVKLDNKLPQNVQNIRWSHKLHPKSHENLVSGMTAGGSSLTEAIIQSGIFQDVLLLILFIIAMVLPWCHLTTHLENAQLDTNLVDCKKISVI